MIVKRSSRRCEIVLLKQLRVWVYPDGDVTCRFESGRIRLPYFNSDDVKEDYRMSVVDDKLYVEYVRKFDSCISWARQEGAFDGRLNVFKRLSEKMNILNGDVLSIEFLPDYQGFIYTKKEVCDIEQEQTEKR